MTKAKVESEEFSIDRLKQIAVMEKVRMIPITALERLEEQIRKRMHEFKPNFTQAYFNGFFDACEEILHGQIIGTPSKDAKEEAST